MNAESLRESIATVRTQIEDLQAEMEAGARCAEVIHADVKIIDRRVVDQHLRLTARLVGLVERSDVLKKSIQDQRSILRDLRRAVDDLRLSLREHRRNRAASASTRVAR